MATSIIKKEVSSQFRFMAISGTSYQTLGQDVMNNIGNITENVFVQGLHNAGGNRAFFGLIYASKQYASLFSLDFNGTLAKYVLSNGTWTRTQL